MKRRLVILLGGLLALGLVGLKVRRPPASIDSGKLHHHLDFSGHTGKLWTVVFSPDGERLASGGLDGTVKIWDRADGRISQSLAHPLPGVTEQAFSPDGSLLATASYDAKLRLWRVSDGALLRTFSGHQGTIWSVAFSPDGKLLVSGGEDRHLRLWSLDQEQPLRRLEGHTLSIWSVAFSPDGQTLASGGFGNELRLWRVSDGAPLRTIEAHDQAVLSVAFTHDGQQLVSGGDDAAVRLWRINNKALLRAFTGAEHIYSVAVSPDDRWILSGGRDRGTLGELWQSLFGASASSRSITVRLWQREDGRLLHTLAHHADDVSSVAFSPDGAWAASASEDERVSVWRLSP